MTRSRDYRRHTKQKAIARTKYILGDIYKENGVWGAGEPRATEEQFDIRCKKFADNRAKCSCWMCGNPRKWNKEKTLKEKMYGSEETNDENY